MALMGCHESREAPPIEEAPEAISQAIESASRPTTSAPARPAADPGWITTTCAGTPAAPWLARAEAHRVQILVREVELEDGKQIPARITAHAFRVDAEYVYPASAIKTLLSVAALNALRARAGDELDRLAENPLADAISRLQIFSDNLAFSELYDFVGHRELNESLWRLGFESVRVHHRMGGTREEGLDLPRVSLAVGGERLVIEARRSDLVLPATRAAKLAVGERHKSRAGELVAEPMSFADKNYVSLDDLQRLNMSLVHPGAPGTRALGLHPDDRALLLRAMSATAPGGEHHKPLLSGVRRVTGDADLRYVGKSGRAYGFHIANAYIENLEARRGLYVTAAIYANPNGIVNDDVYDYEGSTQPFMTALGGALARALLR